MNEEFIIKEIAEEISAIGGKTFFVGGYVRDKYLKKESKDIDVEIFNIQPYELKEILSKHGEVSEIGASFGIYKILGIDIDFAMPRIEKKVAEGHKGFEVCINPFISYKDASKRRDITINSILECVTTGEILDFWGGIEDIKNRIIRHIDDETFIEDPLRVLRICQFSARFDFEVDKKTLELCKTLNLSSLPKERIFEEIKKALIKSKKPSIAFEKMREIGVINQLFPELKNLFYCKQNIKHHPEGTVWNHTMMVLDQASKIKHISSNETNFMFGALCHDLGKPMCTVIKGEQITSIKHEDKGIEIAEKFLRRITTDNNIINYVKEMVKYHMRPYYVYNGSKKSVRRFFLKCSNYKDVVLLSIADHKGRKGKQEDDLDYFLKWFDNQYNKEKDNINPIITGKDLIKFGHKPGKEFGILLKQSLDMQIEGFTKMEIIEKLNLIK